MPLDKCSNVLWPAGAVGDDRGRVSDVQLETQLLQKNRRGLDKCLVQERFAAVPVDMQRFLSARDQSRTCPSDDISGGRRLQVHLRAVLIAVVTPQIAIKRGGKSQ